MSVLGGLDQHRCTAFLGIDYSSRKIALASVQRHDGGVPHAGTAMSYEVSKRLVGFEVTAPKIADWLYSRFIHTSAGEGPIAVEYPISGGSQNRNTAAGLAFAAGMITAVLMERGARGMVRLVPPSSWKREVCGNGSFNKEEVGRWLAERHPDLAATCGNEDEVDAMCLALYAAGVRRGR